MNEYIAGLDEVGRGSLAGRVYTAAVIFPSDFYHPSIRDSKQISEKGRNIAYEIIIKNAIAYSVQWIDSAEIDEINITAATMKAMHNSISSLPVPPTFLKVDGNYFKSYPSIRHECIVQGDAKEITIAAASILAKVDRDNYMREIHSQFPVYNWAKNVGYGSREHISAIKEHGPTSHHRKTFLYKILGED